MLYIGCLIILDGTNSKTKIVSEISIFQLPNLVSCRSKVCPSPLGTPPPHTHTGGMFARRATFLLTTPTSARGLPSDGEGPPNRP